MRNSTITFIAVRHVLACGLALVAFAGCRDEQTRAKLLSGPTYSISVHYAPRNIVRDDGITRSVPPDLADWTGTLVINGFDQRFRTGVLTLSGKQGNGLIKERVRVRPQLDRDSFVIEGTAYDVVKLPAQPAGGNTYTFHADDFLFAYDETEKGWICHGYTNADGAQVDARLVATPTPTPKH